MKNIRIRQVEPMCTPIHRTFAPRPGEFAFQRHLDPLICFCWAHGRDRQTDHATCVATGRIFTLCIAMCPKNYSERQTWRHQFRGQHDDETMKYRQHHGKFY